MHTLFNLCNSDWTSTHDWCVPKLAAVFSNLPWPSYFIVRPINKTPYLVLTHRNILLFIAQAHETPHDWWFSPTSYWTFNSDCVSGCLWHLLSIPLMNAHQNPLINYIQLSESRWRPIWKWASKLISLLVKALRKAALLPSELKNMPLSTPEEILQKSEREFITMVPHAAAHLYTARGPVNFHLQVLWI